MNHRMRKEAELRRILGQHRAVQYCRRASPGSPNRILATLLPGTGTFTATVEEYGPHGQDEEGTVWREEREFVELEEAILYITQRAGASFSDFDS